MLEKGQKGVLVIKTEELEIIIKDYLKSREFKTYAINYITNNNHKIELKEILCEGEIL